MALTQNDSLPEEFLEFLAVEKNVSPRTLDNYDRAMLAFRRWMEERSFFSSWRDCTADHVRAYLFD